MARKRSRSFSILGFLLALAACGIGTTPDASFTLVVSPVQVSVAPGESAAIAIAITRTGGFASGVDLSASGLPDGVTAAFDLASATGNIAILTLAASSGAGAGNATVVITASAGGITRTVSVSLTVSAGSTPSFSLAASPGSLSMAPGTSATSAIAITRSGGFSGSVALSASGLPSGVTASVDPGSATGSSATLTLVASSGTATGSTTVTVTGEGGGITRTAPIGLTISTTQPPSGRVDNPFAGAHYYVNPQWAAQVKDAATRAPSDLSAAVTRVASQPSAFWLDRIAAIDGSASSLGLAGHLDEALKQQASAGAGTPMLMAMIVYDLPDRDCAAFASNGELHTSANGLSRYKSEYIDRIVQVIRSKPSYQQLRIVAVVEPDSLPNIVTNTGLYASCAAAEATYRAGVAYAVQQLATLSNVYLYLDIAHSAWLGWEHPDRAATVYNEVLTAAGGANLVRGFATNVANYSALQEPFNPYNDQNTFMNLIVNFYEWNRMIDEATYVNAMRSRFPNHHFIIDTGRNGWRARAAGVPIEVRTHRGNWCNVTGAGIGERPRADPMAGVDAYYWLKPPGESDGTSDERVTTPDAEGKRYDPMCGPNPVERPYAAGKLIPTNALQGAPAAGHWFEDQFFMLVRNATPAF